MIQLLNIDLDPGIRAWAHREIQTRASVQASNQGGYHSNPWTRIPPDFEPWAEIIEQAVGLKIYNFWINVNGPGHSNRSHSHGQGFAAVGVWYLAVPKNSGNLVIETEPQHTVIEPRPGLFVLHSVDLAHSVTENLSCDTRTSLAFNFQQQ